MAQFDFQSKILPFEVIQVNSIGGKCEQTSSNDVTITKTEPVQRPKVKSIEASTF